MSVKDLAKKVIIIDALTGDVIFSYDIDLLSSSSKENIVRDLYLDFVEGSEHGLLIKIGYKP